MRIILIVNVIIEHETLYDKAMKSYATKLEKGASKLLETDQKSAGVPLGDTR